MHNAEDIIDMLFAEGTGCFALHENLFKLLCKLRIFIDEHIKH
jgi:hypothetical protein